MIHHPNIFKLSFRLDIGVYMKRTISNAIVNRINKFLGDSMTVYELSQKSGIPYPTLKSIMQKRTKSIDFKNVILLAYGLGITPSEFVDDRSFLADNLDIL